MSRQLISHSTDLQRLWDEGYDIEIRGGHLLVKNVPYVNSTKEVACGTLVSVLTQAGGVTTAPADHVAKFIGDHPCYADGTELYRIKHSSQAETLDRGLVVQHSFSAKPTTGAYAAPGQVSGRTPDQLPAASTRICSMPPADTLRDIWAHHAWADAEHWRAFEAFPAALEDAALFERLHHLHLTQSAWVWAISDRRREFVFSKSGDFTPDALKDFAIGNHQTLALAATLDDSEMERRIGIPWFTDPPLQLSVCEGLTQVAMHSHYHRGQNATRLRELGGEPPGSDFITWIWKGRPAASW